MKAFRIPGLVVIIGLLVGGLTLDQSRTEPTPYVDVVVAPASNVEPADARASTWFCAAGTSDDGLASSEIILANTTLDATTAVVTAHPGSANPISAADVIEQVVELPPSALVDLRLADLLPDADVVSVAVEVDGGGVLVEKVASGPTGVARNTCASSASPDWVITTGATVPGARLQLVVFNPFPDEAVIDVEFVSEIGQRTPEELAALHVPARSSRVIEAGDHVAAAETISTFVRARSGRVVVEGIQSFDGFEDPSGLSVVAGAPTTAETWTFPGVSPAIGPARLVVINPTAERIRADVDVLPSGAEREVEPLELTLRPGQQATVDLVDEGRLADLDSFSLVVRSLDGPGLVAGLEQRPAVEEPDVLDQFLDEVEAPTTGFAASAGSPAASLRSYATIDVTEDDTRSALHVYNPAPDTFVTIEATIILDGVSRTVAIEVGPQRTRRVPLVDLGIGRYAVRLDASGPIVAAREITGLTSRQWAPLVAEG